MLEYLDIAIGFAVVMLLLSLIVTAIVQAVSTLLDLRGNNLVWALARLFDQMPIAGIAAPRTAADGQKRMTVSMEIASAVASHPSITIAQSKFLGLWQRAKAIRPAELLHIVRRLAVSPPDGMTKEAKDALRDLMEEHAPSEVEAVDEARYIAKQLEPFVAAHGQVVRDAIDKLTGRTRLIGTEVATWFDTIMDRSSDRFARTTRVWSVVVAAVLTFAFQVNAVSVFKQISTNAGVRSQLVAMAQPAMDQAKQIEAYANIGGKTFAEMKREDAFKAALEKAPASVARCPDGEEWIRQNAPADAALLQSFHDRCDTRATEAIGELPAKLQTLEQGVAQAGIKIYGRWGQDPFGWAEFFGCLATVALLGLGAPFWFNALRQMATLRPPISQKITRDKTAEAPVEPAGSAATR